MIQFLIIIVLLKTPQNIENRTKLKIKTPKNIEKLVEHGIMAHMPWWLSQWKLSNYIIN